MTSVVLTGFMGSGKSTVGPILAARLGRPFVDLDQLVEAEAGMPVSAIFAREGEEGFRRRESACLDRALSRDQQVLAVGGGAPMPEENWSRLRQGNVVVALLASEQTLAGRLDGAGERPLLEAGVGASIGRLLPARLPRYRQADLLVATDACPPEAVAAAVADRLPLGGLSRIPVRVRIHSSLVSISAESSWLVTTRSGTEKPVPRNREWGMPCDRYEENVIRELCWFPDDLLARAGRRASASRPTARSRQSRRA